MFRAGRPVGLGSVGLRDWIKVLHLGLRVGVSDSGRPVGLGLHQSRTVVFRAGRPVALGSVRLLDCIPSRTFRVFWPPRTLGLVAQ